MALATYGVQAMGCANFAAFYATLPGNLTVRQNLRVFGLLYEVKGLSERINALIRQFDLEKFRNVKWGVLSSGEQARVALAKAMLNPAAKNRSLRAWATLPFGTSGLIRQTRDDGPARTTRAWSVWETDANRTAATGAFG